MKGNLYQLFGDSEDLTFNVELQLKALDSSCEVDSLVHRALPRRDARSSAAATMPTSVATREHEHSINHPPPKVKYPFWFGGSASCFAAVVTHPLDLGKWS